MLGDIALSISVAAYNVSEYIDRALSSCLIDDLEKIEVIVVNDGSTDDTLAHARRYQKEFPGSFKVINQVNGGYGTTVNASLAIARGRFFKLLDGDDWFDTASLQRLVNIAMQSEADLIISAFSEIDDQGAASVVDQANQSMSGIVKFSSDVVPDRLSMHSATYRTDLVRMAGFELPARRLYTDTLYDVATLPLVNSVFVSHDSVYQYYVGRLGQSVSASSLIAHRNDMFLIAKDLCTFYGGLEERDGPAAIIARNWAAEDACWALRLLLQSPEHRESRELVDSIFETVHALPDVYEECVKRSATFRFLDGVPKSLYPFASLVYRLTRRLVS